MDKQLQYKQRAIDSDELMSHYTKHVEAMTKEGLHNKSAIAAELAHRDYLLQEANKEIEDQLDYIRILEKENYHLEEYTSDIELELEDAYDNDRNYY